MQKFVKSQITFHKIRNLEKSVIWWDCLPQRLKSKVFEIFWNTNKILSSHFFDWILEHYGTCKFDQKIWHFYCGSDFWNIWLWLGNLKCFESRQYLDRRKSPIEIAHFWHKLCHYAMRRQHFQCNLKALDFRMNITLALGLLA